MNNYIPNFIEPDVLEKIEKIERDRIEEIRNRPMEESIQRFNPNYHFADFENIYVPTVRPHHEGVKEHNVLDMDITAHNKAVYYKNKIPEYLPKITTTITPNITGTTLITTTTRIEIISTIEKIYLKYDKENDTWEDITSTYKILCDKIQIYNWLNDQGPEHGYW